MGDYCCLILFNFLFQLPEVSGIKYPKLKIQKCKTHKIKSHKYEFHKNHLISNIFTNVHFLWIIDCLYKLVFPKGTQFLSESTLPWKSKEISCSNIWAIYSHNVYLCKRCYYFLFTITKKQHYLIIIIFYTFFLWVQRNYNVLQDFQLRELYKIELPVPSVILNIIDNIS